MTVAEGIGELALRRRILTPSQLADCERLRGLVRRRFGLEYTLGAVICERIYASNPRTRPILVRIGGPAELLGADFETGFWKFTTGGYDRFLERVQRDGIAGALRIREAKEIERELARLGVLRRAGEILVDKGYVERELAEEYLRPAPDLESLPGLAFARIAVQNGFVSERDAADALELADEIREDVELRIPIGQIFYELGHLRRSEVEAILAAQARIGRLAPGDARLGVLRLSEAEEDALTARLVERGAVPPAEIDPAERISSRLAEYGLEVSALEVLRLQGRLADEAIRDVVESQRAALARLEPDLPSISLSLAPSAGALAGQGPKDLPEADFLFGQFAIIAGAVNRVELELSVSILRRCRRDLGLDPSLGQVLCDRYRTDPGRMRLLRQAQRELSQYLGRPYEIPVHRASPLEIAIVEERLASRTSEPGLGEEIERSVRASRILSEMGIEKHAVEILDERGGLAAASIRDLSQEARERDRRMVALWRRRREGVSPAQSLFEMALSTSLSGPGWGRGHLGSLAVEKGLLKPHELVEALYVQLRTREIGIVKPFGEILVELGRLSPGALAALLDEQARRVVRIREEAGVPEEPLEREDETLLVRLRATGALDEDRIREALRVRARLRSLGLAGSLREIVVRRGDLDEEIVRGLLREAAREERTSVRDVRQVYQEAVRGAALPRVLRTRAEPLPAARRPAALVAGIGILALFATGGVLAWLGDSSTRESFLLRNEAPPDRGGAEADGGSFAEAMRGKRYVLVDGRWVPEDAPREEAVRATSAGKRRTAFAERMRREGYLEAGGAWIRPDAYRRLVEAKARGDGLVRAAGRWRSVSFAAGETPAPSGGLPFASFEAALHVEGDRTRVGLRFESALPPEASYVLVVSSAGEGSRVLHAVVFRPMRNGRLELEVEPIPRALERGTYAIRLSYRPEDQDVAVRRIAGRPVAVAGEFALDGPAGDDSWAEALERIAMDLEGILVKVETPDLAGEALRTWAREAAGIAGSCRDRLIERASSGRTDSLAPAQDHLISAARRLAEGLARLAAGEPPGADLAGRARREIEEARRFLAKREIR